MYHLAAKPFNGQHWAVFANFLFNSVYCHAWGLSCAEPDAYIHAYSLLL